MIDPPKDDSKQALGFEIFVDVRRGERRIAAKVEAVNIARHLMRLENDNVTGGPMAILAFMLLFTFQLHAPLPVRGTYLFG